MISSLATPLDATMVKGPLSWGMLQDYHGHLAHSLRKKLDHVPPTRKDMHREDRYIGEETSQKMQASKWADLVRDDVIWEGFKMWNTVNPAPTGEILIDLAYQLSCRSSYSIQDWFVLLCGYVDPVTSDEPFTSFLQDEKPTNAFRTLKPRLYGRNGSRTKLPIHCLDSELQPLVEAFRTGDCIVELLTTLVMGDIVGDMNRK